MSPPICANCKFCSKAPPNPCVRTVFDECWLLDSTAPTNPCVRTPAEHQEFYWCSKRQCGVVPYAEKSCHEPWISVRAGPPVPPLFQEHDVGGAVKKQPGWLTAYGRRGFYDLTIWMRNSSISDFK
jgi:hypothetical protein